MDDVRSVSLISVYIHKVLWTNCFKWNIASSGSLYRSGQFAHQQHGEMKMTSCLFWKVFIIILKTKTGNSFRTMFFDFSSAFNTVDHIYWHKVWRPYQRSRIRWFFGSLNTSPTEQFVELSPNVRVTSSAVVPNTGVPQGTALVPLLFTLYTSDGRSDATKCHLVKLCRQYRCNLFSTRTYSLFF